jgi:ElaB/YqjD/DUF883 family membrane-anchored ribosome-binding protein
LFLQKELYQSKQCVLLDEGAKIERPRLKAWVDSAEGFIREHGNTTIAFDSALNRLDDVTQQQIQQLEAKFDELRVFLDEIQTKLADSIRSVAAEQSANVQDALNEVVTMLNGVEDTVHESSAALRSGDPVSILKCQESTGIQRPTVRVQAYYAPSLTVSVDAVKQCLAQTTAINLVAGPIELPSHVDPMTIEEDAQRQYQSNASSS